MNKEYRRTRLFFGVILGLNASTSALMEKKLETTLKAVGMKPAACKDDKSCKDLTPILCQPGTLDDGTGYSWRGTDAERDAKDRKDLEVISKTYFEKNLKTNKKLYEAIQLKCPSDKTEELLVACATRYGVDLVLDDGSKSKSLSFSQRLKGSVQRKKTDKIFDDFYAVIQEKITNPNLQTEVEDDLETVKKGLVSFIQNSNAPDASKTKMIKVIQDIYLEDTNCDEQIKSKSKVDSLLVSNAFYDPDLGALFYCNGIDHYNSSRFNRYFTIAHELAHSIDPCAFEESHKPFPITGLIGCLRSESSIAAKLGDEAKAKKDPESTQCKSFDQIDEVFADYAATEVLVDLMKDKSLTPEQFQNGFTNTLREVTSCDGAPTPDPKNHHPPSKDRLNKIVAAHPTVRKLMGCDSVPTVQYCGSKIK